jgi:hypothetical protein
MGAKLTPRKFLKADRQRQLAEQAISLEREHGVVGDVQRAEEVEENRRPYRGVPAGLVDDERASWLQLSPRRNRWREVAEYDRKVAELDAESQRVREQATAVHEQLRDAPAADHDARARWIAKGRPGRPPTASVPELERQRDDLQAELDALDHLRRETLGEKGSCVQRHRSRLARDAEKYTEQAARRYRQLVDDLEQARVDLSDARSTSLWVRLYPNEPNLLSVPRRGFAGDLRRPLTRAGLSGPIATEHVFDLLRVDVDWLEHAASLEQRKLLGEKREQDAVWLDTEEGEAWRRQQQTENAERIKRAQRAGTGWE